MHLQETRIANTVWFLVWLLLPSTPFVLCGSDESVADLSDVAFWMQSKQINIPIEADAMGKKVAGDIRSKLEAGKSNSTKTEYYTSSNSTYGVLELSYFNANKVFAWDALPICLEKLFAITGKSVHDKANLDSFFSKLPGQFKYKNIQVTAIQFFYHGSKAFSTTYSLIIVYKLLPAILKINDTLTGYIQDKGYTCSITDSAQMSACTGSLRDTNGVLDRKWVTIAPLPTDPQTGKLAWDSICDTGSEKLSKIFDIAFPSGSQLPPSPIELGVFYVQLQSEAYIWVTFLTAPVAIEQQEKLPAPTTNDFDREKVVSLVEDMIWNSMKAEGVDYLVPNELRKAGLGQKATKFVTNTAAMFYSQLQCEIQPTDSRIQILLKETFKIDGSIETARSEFLKKFQSLEIVEPASIIYELSFNGDGSDVPTEFFIVVVQVPNKDLDRQTVFGNMGSLNILSLTRSIRAIRANMVPLSEQNQEEEVKELEWKESIAQDALHLINDEKIENIDSYIDIKYDFEMPGGGTIMRIFNKGLILMLQDKTRPEIEDKLLFKENVKVDGSGVAMNYLGNNKYRVVILFKKKV